MSPNLLVEVGVFLGWKPPFSQSQLRQLEDIVETGLANFRNPPPLKDGEPFYIDAPFPPDVTF